MKAAWGALRTVTVVVVGWVLLLGGIALLPLPGPGMLVVFAGLVVLSTRYAWARKLREKAASGVEAATKESMATKKRIFAAVIGASCAIGVGVALIMDVQLPSWIDFNLFGLEFGPSIPGAGPATGLPVLLGGIAALGVLVYARLAYAPDGEVGSDIAEDLKDSGLAP